MASRARGWIIGLAAIVAVVVVVLVAVPFFVPVGVVTNRVVSAVHEATGRDLAIKGGVSLSFFPKVGVTAKEVSLSNAPWAGPQPMASLGALDVRLKVLPLLSGKVAVDSFVLENPVINLATDKQGHGNWEFATPRPAAPAQPPAKAEERRGVPEIALADFRISNGRLVYTDGATGRSQTIDDVNVKISLPGSDSPAVVTGSARWRDHRLDVSMRADNADALLRGTGTPVALNISSDLAKLGIKGSASLRGTAKGEGDIALNVPSVRNLAQWMGQPNSALPAGGLGPMQLQAHASVNGPQAAFTNLRFSLDAIKAAGQMALDTKARPNLTGRLDIERLDLTPYLPPETARGQAAAAGGGKGGRTAWSEEPIDLSALRSADVDLAVSAGSLAMRRIEIGKTALRVVSNNGRLTLDLGELALYQGNAKGRVSLDASGPVLAAKADLTLAKVQAEPLLAAVAGVDLISGTAGGETSVTTRGRSQRDLVAGLDGRGRLAFTDGAIKGINLGAMVRNVASAFSGRSSNDKTEFTELSGSYTITNGVLKNQDLSLMSPFIRVAGAGTVDLPAKSMDFRLVPQLAATAKGQGGPKAVEGVSVPVLVRGPWDDLTYAPDLSGVVSQQLDKNAGKLLGIITGGKGPGQQEAQGAPRKEKPSGGLPIPIPIPGLH